MVCPSTAKLGPTGARDAQPVDAPDPLQRAGDLKRYGLKKEMHMNRVKRLALLTIIGFVFSVNSTMAASTNKIGILVFDGVLGCADSMSVIHSGN